jgi:hypothetical protein
MVIRVAAFLGGSFLLAGLFVHFGPARILSLLTSLSWNFLAVVSLFLAHEFVRTLAIRRWLPADRRPPLREMLIIRLFGEGAGALTRTGSLAAEPARAWLLARRGAGAVPGYSAAVGELMTNGAISAAVNVVVSATALLLVEIKGPIVVLAHMVLWGSLAYLLVVAGIVSSRRSLLEAGARAASMLPLVGRRVRPRPGTMGELQQSISSALTQGPVVLARIVLLELAAQTILVGEVYWTVRSMGVPVSGRSALFMEIMTRPLTIVEMVGATEMGFAAVFTWLGMPAAFGFSLSLVKTLRSLTAAGIGVLAGLNIPAMLSSRKDTPSLHIVHAGDARVP